MQASRVAYCQEQDLGLAEFRQILDESGMAPSRPMHDDARLAGMLTGANLMVTARLDGRLVGLARCMTDFTWCCYLSDLMVSATAQRLGIGRGLLDELRRLVGPEVSVILVSVPDAVGFYDTAGMARIPDAFWYRRTV